MSDAASLHDIDAPAPRRRYSARPFPAYRFVPGLYPHPTRDPRGHSFAHAAVRHGGWRVEDWRALDDWLFGVDLFNAHFFWEAHEAWEGLWSAQPRDSAPAVFLQGLIQVAAALLKAHLGSEAGARSLAATGLGKVRQVARDAPVMMGLDLGEAIPRFEAYFAPPGLFDLATAPVLRLDA